MIFLFFNLHPSDTKEQKITFVRSKQFSDCRNLQWCKSCSALSSTTHKITKLRKQRIYPVVRNPVLIYRRVKMMDMRCEVSVNVTNANVTLTLVKACRQMQHTAQPHGHVLILHGWLDTWHVHIALHYITLYCRHRHMFAAINKNKQNDWY